MRTRSLQFEVAAAERQVIPLWQLIRSIAPLPLLLQQLLHLVQPLLPGIQDNGLTGEPQFRWLAEQF